MAQRNCALDPRPTALPTIPNEKRNLPVLHEDMSAEVFVRSRLVFPNRFYSRRQLAEGDDTQPILVLSCLRKEDATAEVLRLVKPG